jgi:UDP-N-acetyl-D-glucosamine dehydrogenase
MNIVENPLAQRLLHLIDTRSARVGVMGMGYVGLPLAMAACRANFKVVGFDVDEEKINSLNAGISYIGSVDSADLAGHVKSLCFVGSADMAMIAQCHILIICVPTPLSRNREPDLSFVRQTAEVIAARMQPGTLVVLESTTYPGTTAQVVKPILENSAPSPESFFVGYSPEREDPGNKQFHTTSIPKIVAGEGKQAGELVSRFYGAIVEKIVPVSSTATAEAVKITENVFRAVNIALVNELKIIYDAMGIDVWEVIDAAKTKPFGFQAFYPGPGLGGHCIPIDPFYLTWKAREFDIHTRFIELAGEINTSMPRYVVTRTEEALGTYASKPLAGSKLLILGLAYKKNVPDMRESPTFKLMELLEKRGAFVEFHDPLIGVIGPTREHAEFEGRKSFHMTSKNLAAFDVIVVSTDHDAIDYEMIAASARIVVDTRNRFKGLERPGLVIVKA